MFKFLTKLLPVQTAYAHCDVPCGVYSSEPSRIAATTVFVMVQKLNALPIQEDRDTEAQANFIRMVETKEEHAQKCKTELLILWTDYFKPEHLEMFPDLHDTFWKATKLCSENKQHVSLDSAKQLVAIVNKIGDMYAKTNPKPPATL